MSYILDALRKADSERERGAVPTLHSHPEHAVQGRQAGTQARAWPGWLRPQLAAGLVLLLLLAGGLLTPWLKPEPAAAPLAQRPPVAVTAPAPAPSPAPRAAALAPPITSALTAPPPAPEPVPLPSPVPAAPATRPAEAQIPKLADLPEATRKSLPAITTSGAMYSDAPANRMLIVNGQLLREGDKIGPDLLLEHIELKSAVLLFKGQRFRLNY